MPERTALMEASLRELAYILQWLERADLPGTVLIGGWAVQAYNLWYGSIDIDLVMTARARERLKHHLARDRGYADSSIFGGRDPGFGLEHGAGRIVLETFNRAHPQPFESLPRHRLDFTALDEEGATVQGSIDGVQATVPRRELLLGFKLKAAWDRAKRVEENRSPDPVYEAGKVVKDHADVLALLDPDAGGRTMDLAYLAGFYERFPFLVEVTRAAYRDLDATRQYGVEPGEAEDWVERMLGLAVGERGK